MKPLLNTLYVTTPDVYAHREGMDVVISLKGNDIFRISCLTLNSVVLFGAGAVSTGLMESCHEQNLSLIFLSRSGKYVGRYQPSTQGSVLLRMRQYEIAKNTPESLHIAQIMIAGKIQNYRCSVMRYMRDHGEAPRLQEVVELLARAKKNALLADSAETLRGIEGFAANAYFSIFSNLILKQKDDFFIQQRLKHPSPDRTNALLSYVYMMLTYETQSALETVGLDPYVGFFHRLRPGRASLALDVIEEFRSYLGDRLVLSLINRGQLDAKDFWQETENSCVLTEKARKTVISEWQRRKSETIIHPYLQEKVQIGLLPYIQALLLARYLRGDLDDYPVFVVR